MAKSRKKKSAKRKPAKRKSSSRKVAPRRGGQWHLVFVAVLALMVGIAAGWHFRDSGMAANATPSAQSQAPKPAAMRLGEVEREGRKAVDAWLKTVSSGNVAAVRAVLAPEFQVTRSDGSAYNAGEYVRSGLPRMDSAPVADRLAITSNGDHLVTRYWVKVSEMAGGKRVEAYAPRMTVFRKSGDAWIVVAHANFASIPR
jgi:ketosteroid isomerase-like protein